MKGVISVKIVQHYCEGCNPGYQFSVEAMKMLIEANPELDPDVYCMGGTVDE